MSSLPRAFTRVLAMTAVALAVAYLIEYDWTRAVVCILGALILELVAEGE
jgi:hypothetical protein